ncbi:MAG TPA: tetratricopeptide repeat protein [Thermoanaerobaculia bacterium]|nr:tetratricopeptide repeat protein [Thermoanaerobaculia bacterium]
MNAHYDELTLQEYLDDPESFEGRAVLETHLALCRTCSLLLEELRAFEATLSRETKWELASAAVHDQNPPPEIRALAELLAGEDLDAAVMLSPLLGSPASFRRANITAMPLMRTAGIVRRLCRESRALRERQPMHALVVADAAIALADQLSHARYPQTLLDELRGDAWLERANVLRYLGRHEEALDAADIAARAFAQSPVAAYSTALVNYLRGVIYVELERLPEALRFVRRAARVFREFGEEERFVHAKIVEATVLFDQNRVREARDLFLSLVRIAKNIGEAPTLARLYNNVANCQLRLHELESAEVYYARALSLYEALGLETERIRTRWNIGCLRIATGDLGDGLARLREARREFEQLGLRSDAALVTLDIAEALLATGEAAAAREAAELCSAILESFASVGMTGHALTALAFLREAFATGSATPSLVRHVRHYLETRPDQTGVPFLPPSHL